MCFFYCSIRYEQLKTLLRRFARIDSNKDGLISIEDLAVFLKVPHDACLQSVFDTIDVVSVIINVCVIFLYIQAIKFSDLLIQDFTKYSDKLIMTLDICK